MIFDYDWWFGPAYTEQIDEAKRRCAAAHFPDYDPAAQGDPKPEHKQFIASLEQRTVLYLRDGFSYEIKDLVRAPTTSSLTFECLPADDAYRVGSFVVTVPFEDVVRVEVFAVHPDEKPEDMPSIKGFGAAQPPPGTKRPERAEDRTS